MRGVRKEMLKDLFKTYQNFEDKFISFSHFIYFNNSYLQVS